MWFTFVKGFIFISVVCVSEIKSVGYDPALIPNTVLEKILIVASVLPAAVSGVISLQSCVIVST